MSHNSTPTSPSPERSAAGSSAAAGLDWFAHVDWPDWQDIARTARVVSIPMPVKFRGITRREALLVRGPVGWGEFSPFVEYGDEESSRWLLAALEAAWAGWPEPRRDRIDVNATVPAIPAAEVESVLGRFPGARTAKVKVAERGQTLADDIARVEAVRAQLGDDAAVRIDANAGWSVDEALDGLRALTGVRLEYAEQPVPTVPEMAEVRRRVAAEGLDVPIAADESIRKADDPLRVARAGAADLMIVKTAPLGGVRAALAIADECGLPAVVSSALDTSVGIRAGLALAAALPELRHACGLATVGLFSADVAARPLLPVDGALPVGDVEVDEDQLDRLAAPPGRRDWWLDRLRRCYTLLTR